MTSALNISKDCKVLVLNHNYYPNMDWTCYRIIIICEWILQLHSCSLY